MALGQREQEPRLVGPAAHAVVAGAVRGPEHDGEVRHRRVGDGVDHHRAVLDDAALLVLLADHVAGGVLQEQQRRVGAVGELDELRRLLRLLAEQHAAGVGEDADRVAVQAGPAGDERRAVERLELVELGAVDDAGDDLARVERRLQVGGDEAEQLVRVVHRRRDVGGRRRAELAPVEAGDDAPADADGVALVGGEVVGQPGDAASASRRRRATRRRPPRPSPSSPAAGRRGTPWPAP